jgi:hypothetical protein
MYIDRLSVIVVKNLFSSVHFKYEALTFYRRNILHIFDTQHKAPKPEGKRPLGRPRRRWEDGISIDLREIGLGDVDWIRLAQDRDRWRAVVSAVMNLRVLSPRS